MYDGIKTTAMVTLATIILATGIPSIREYNRAVDYYRNAPLRTYIVPDDSLRVSLKEIGKREGAKSFIENLAYRKASGERLYDTGNEIDINDKNGIPIGTVEENNERKTIDLTAFQGIDIGDKKDGLPVAGTKVNIIDGNFNGFIDADKPLDYKPPRKKRYSPPTEVIPDEEIQNEDISVSLFSQPGFKPAA